MDTPEIEEVSGKLRTYVVHEGWVDSTTDGQPHLISASEVARLYGLQTSEYVLYNYMRNYDPDLFVHLHPDFRGEYKLPDPQRVAEI